MFPENDKEEIKQVYISKHNFNCGNEVILLMITDSEKCHYSAVKNLSALLRVITWKHNGN